MNNLINIPILNQTASTTRNLQVTKNSQAKQTLTTNYTNQENFILKL